MRKLQIKQSNKWIDIVGKVAAEIPAGYQDIDDIAKETGYAVNTMYRKLEQAVKAGIVAKKSISVKNGRKKNYYKILE